ncbi:hypothetical protein ACVW0P_003348 [Mucilaginibacter sp. UYNi724]
MQYIVLYFLSFLIFLKYFYEKAPFFTFLFDLLIVEQYFYD